MKNQEIEKIIEENRKFKKSNKINSWIQVIGSLILLMILVYAIIRKLMT